MLKRDLKAIQESIDHWEEIKSLFEILAPETKSLDSFRAVPTETIISHYPAAQEILDRRLG